MSRRRLGSVPGGFSGAPWAVFGRLGPSWDVARASWAALWASWGRAWAVLAAPGAERVHRGGILGVPRASREPYMGAGCHRGVAAWRCGFRAIRAPNTSNTFRRGCINRGLEHMFSKVVLLIIFVLSPNSLQQAESRQALVILHTENLVLPNSHRAILSEPRNSRANHALRLLAFVGSVRALAPTPFCMPVQVCLRNPALVV